MPEVTEKNREEQQ